MSYFRTPSPPAAAPLSIETIPRLLTEVLQPGSFFVGPAISLEWKYQVLTEERWEIFQGRLLDPGQTRQRRIFEAWNVFLVDASGRSAEPLLSLKLDLAAGELHVTRAIYSYAWEGYHEGDHVYLSRETRKWVRELIGTICLARFADVHALRDEVIGLLFQAVVGTSRLPLTSVEAPLPAFSLGQLAYVYRSDLGSAAEASHSLRSFRDLIDKALRDDLAWLERTKLLEAALRSISVEEVAAAAECFVAQWNRLGHTTAELVALVRTLFNEVALSPYTALVDNALAWIGALVGQGYLTVADQVDFLSFLLRQLGRHLTAYDLITYHHRGANYPDALFLDAVLRAQLQVLEAHPELFLSSPDEPAPQQHRKRLRRRALRQGWLLRCRYQGLPVPDLPTSTGENMRVLPPPFERVPEEQIVMPARRTKQLFAGKELTLPAGTRAAAVLQQSMADLHQPAELQELGMALFLDRPLGLFKAPAEPDRTLLFSYEAYSPSIAHQRLHYLADQLGLIPDAADYEALQVRLRNLPPNGGLAVPSAPSRTRPGVVSLQDACRVAPDFVFLRTTRTTVQAFLAQFDFAAVAPYSSLGFLSPQQRVLILDPASGTAGAAGMLTIYDAQLRERLELQVDAALGYERRAGQEFPAAGLRVLRVWEPEVGQAQCREYDVRAECRVVRPR